MREEVIDSNIFVAALVKEDRFHPEAIRIIEDMADGRRTFHISAIVPVEVCGALSRRVGVEEAHEAGSILKEWIGEGRVKLYPLDEKRMDAASEIAINHKLKGADAIIAQLSQELGMSLLSFDQEIPKQFRGKQGYD